MKRLLSCEFNFNTVCVELKYSDGTMTAIEVTDTNSQIPSQPISTIIIPTFQYGKWE